MAYESRSKYSWILVTLNVVVYDAVTKKYIVFKGGIQWVNLLGATNDILI